MNAFAYTVRPAFALLVALAVVVASCAQPEIAPKETPTTTATPGGPPRYTTRELPLQQGATASAMTLWEGKVVYTAYEKDERGGIIDSRIFQYDLETGEEKLLVKPQPGHKGATLLHRSGDWLVYRESGIVEPTIPPIHIPPSYRYMYNLRTGEKRFLSGHPSPLPSGSYTGAQFVYMDTKTDPSTRVPVKQIRIYDIETGEDKVVLQVEDLNTGFTDVALYGDKVVFSQSWRWDWPPGVTATAVPGRPGPGPRQQRIGDIFSLDLKTGEIVNLSNNGSASHAALWGDYLMYIDSPGGSQEHGSGEVCVLNMKTGERKVLTNDATYMHLYTSTRAGDGFFIWSDAHQVKTAVRVYFPESDEMVYLQGPEGKPQAGAGDAEGKVLFWGWSDWSGVPTPPQYEQTKDQQWKVFMTTFE